MNKWSIAAVTAILTFSVTACSSGGSQKAAQTPKAEGTSATTGAKTKLTYWTFDRHDAEFMKEAIAKFNKENQAGLEVEINVMAENYNQALDVAFASNQAPDIFRARPSDVPTFYKKQYMEPLDGYMSPDLKKKFAGLLVDKVNQMDGKTYSLPNFAFTSRLIYNVDLFEKAGIKSPPKTLPEMVDSAKKLRESGKESGTYGFAVNFKNPMNAFDKSIKVIAQMSGFGGYGYNFKTGKFDFSPQKEIIEAFRKMKQDGSMLPGVESLDIDPLRAQFAEGKIGMYLSLSAEVGVFKDQFPAKIKWASSPIPSINGAINGAADMLNGGTWLVMNKNSANKDKAWKFMEAMYSEQVLTSYYETGQGITLVPFVTEKGKKPTTANIGGFLPTRYDALWPVSPSVKQEGASFADTYVKYYLEGGDLNKVIDDLNKRYNAALDKEIAAGTVTQKPIPDFDPAKFQGTVAK
jgi:multiple sugar transport system substrate-binding protein